MDDVTILFPPVDGAGLHLAADFISLHDESAAVLVGILSKRYRAILLDENLTAGGGSSSPRTVKFERLRWGPKGNPTGCQRWNQREYSRFHLSLLAGQFNLLVVCFRLSWPLGYLTSAVILYRAKHGDGGVYLSTQLPTALCNFGKLGRGSLPLSDGRPSGSLAGP
jgi:hypothetical protein